MLTVHHLNNSRSQRVLWLLEELGIEYQIKHYQRDAKTMLAPPELRKVHPLGKSPVITDGDVTVAESGAIIDYIVERYGNGRLVPAAGTPEKLRYTYWMHYAEGSIMPLLVMKLIFSFIPKRSPALIRPIANGIANNVEKNFLGPNLRTHLDYIENELGQSGWFAGAGMTAADVQMSFPLEAAAIRGGGAPRPRITAFLERIHTRPAYQRALKKGGPYQLMG
ncbi:MAG: glutathione S-transferase family protein [Stenotrophobium sp.]